MDLLVERRLLHVTPDPFCDPYTGCRKLGSQLTEQFDSPDSRKLEVRSLAGRFLRAIVHAALVTFEIIAALSKVGVQMTSFVAIIGAAGLAIGLVLQGSLSNFAAGVLIIIFKPHRVGDFVVAGGDKWIIEEFGIFTITLITLDNRTQIAPNPFASVVIENYTKKGRVDWIW